MSTSSSETSAERVRSSSSGTARELRERLLERLARRASLVRVLAPAPHAMVLLGGVRELEVEREGAQHRRLVAGGQRTHGLAHRRRVADLARAPGAGPDQLLGGEEVLALLLDEDAAEQRPEQADVSAQRAVGLFLAGRVAHASIFAAAGPAAAAPARVRPEEPAERSGRPGAAGLRNEHATTIVMQVPSVRSCSAIIRSPAYCWSFSAEIPNSRTCWAE